MIQQRIISFILFWGKSYHYHPLNIAVGYKFMLRPYIHPVSCRIITGAVKNPSQTTAVNTKKEETKKSKKTMSVLCKSRTLLDVCPGDGEDGCGAVGGGRHHAEWLGAPAHDGGAARGHHRVRGQEGGQVGLDSCKGGVIIRAVNEKFSQ